MGVNLAEVVDPVDQATPTSVPAFPWPAEEGKLICRSQFTGANRENLERIAFAYGSAPESYDVVISKGSLLATPCGQGVLAVLPDRRYWHMPGGLLAADELKPHLVQWLKRISDENRITAAVYSIADDDVPIFLDAGFEVSKFGEEPVLDLGSITWKGKEFEWVRRQTNFCRRAGLQVVELADDDDDRYALAPELVSILREDLSAKTYSQPLRLMEGEFDPLAMFRRRLFLARSAETGRIEAFLACSPMQNGTAWSFETYRKRNDAPRGTIAFLFREVIDQLQSEGAKLVSLCLVPGKGTDEQSSPTASWMVRLSMSLWYKRLNFLFNSKGQNYFKSRFRPRFVNRSVCVTPGTSIMSITSFMRTAGAFTPNLRNLASNIWNCCGNSLPE